jgi:1,4-dihydroxy-6-naphthoate synthase
MDPKDLARGLPVAVPGELTTAALVTRLVLPGAVHVHVPFDEVPDAVLSGRAAAGVLIHEGQLTYASHGLVKLMDFGEWWATETSGLPLPLGLDAVRSDLGESVARVLNRALKDSIAYAFDHADAALEYARGFGRGIDPDVNSRFVNMYVNGDTRELPDDAKDALVELYRRAVAAGCLDSAPEVRVVG